MLFSHQVLSVSMDFPDKNTGAGCHFLLQGIFLTQGSNLYLFCLPHCRWTLYPMSHRGSPACYNPSTFPLSKYSSGTSLVVQWLKLCTDTAGGHGFDPWSGNWDPARLYCRANKYTSWISQSDLSETVIWLCCHTARRIFPQLCSNEKNSNLFFK